MKKSILFARFGLIIPLINFLDDIGSPINLRLQKANIPAEILKYKERITPLPMLIQFIGKTAKAEGIEIRLIIKFNYKISVFNVKFLVETFLNSIFSAILCILYRILMTFPTFFNAIVTIVEEPKNLNNINNKKTL